MTLAFAQAEIGGAAPAPQPGNGGRGFPGMGMMGMGMQGMQQAPEMTITPNGIFILKSGVLMRFDTKLKQQGTSLELFGALAVQPPMSETPTDAERQAMMAWMRDAAPRMSPAAMLAKDDELLIVIGTTLFRVNQKTLVLDTKQTKLVAQADMAENRPLAALMTGKPVLQLNDKTLYIIIGANLAAVNADTGDVLSTGVLPKETTVNMMNMMRPMRNGGGNGGGGVRGGGGGRGAGGNDNAPAAGRAAQ